MIIPKDVKISPRSEDYAKIEAIIDAELSKPWVEGEQRIVYDIGKCKFRQRLSHDPLVLEMTRKYQKAGWDCQVYGYDSILFRCPRTTKKWWFF